MKNDPDSGDEGEIGDIILGLWKEGKSLTEISEESGEPVATVIRILKKIQKTLLRTKRD